MRKLILTCDCGQRIQLPRTAVGKTGVCPTCGRAIPITKNNTKPLTAKERQRTRILGGNSGRWKGAGGEVPSDEARRLFGRGADLFCEGRYGEALAVFDSLIRRFPGIPEIENARKQCMAARSRPMQALPRPGETSQAGGGGDANPETVKRIVLEKMLYAKSEAVQLQAAELMARILGMFDKQLLPGNPEDEAQDETQEEPQEEPRQTAEINEESEPPVKEEDLSFTDFTLDSDELSVK